MGARRMWATAIVLVVGASGVIDSHEGQSLDAADQLIKALRERKMQHLAARDPAEKGRYVAATMIGDSQLLLVSARYSQPALFDERLYRGDHQGAYTELNAASVSTWLAAMWSGCRSDQ